MREYKDDFSKTIENMAENDSKFKKEWEILDQVEKLIDELVTERKRQKLSQRDLAKLSGLKQEAIARMETMQAIPRLDTFVKVASALNHDLVFRDIELQKAINHFSKTIDEMSDQLIYATTALLSMTFDPLHSDNSSPRRNHENTQYDTHYKPGFAA